MKIGERIEKERIKNNISKTKLAEMIGCTSRAIDYWENGKRSISLENIISLWLRCEITGDGAMSEIIKILDEEGKYKNEVANVYIKE